MCYLGDVAKERRGDLGKALKDYRSALDTAEKMVDKLPNDKNWILNKAEAANLVGDTYSKKGERQSALIYFEKSQKAYQILKAQKEDDLYYSAKLSESFFYSNLGDHHAKYDYDAALKDYRNRHDILSELQSIYPYDINVKTHLAMSLKDMGDIEVQTNHIPEAHSHYTKSWELMEQLNKEKPDDPNILWDLTRIYNSIGDLLRDQGMRYEANYFYIEINRIWKDLVKKDPTNSVKKRSLAATHSRIGDLLMAEGKLKESQDYYDNTTSIFEELVNRDSKNVECRQDLAICYRTKGDLLMALDNRQGAEEFYRKAENIYSDLYNPGNDFLNLTLQRDLATFKEREGDFLLAKGSCSVALKKYEEEIRLAAELAQKEQSDPSNKRLLSAGLTRAGDALMVAGKHSEARQKFEDSFKIRKQLFDATHNNPVSHRDLVISYHKIGFAQSTEGNREAENSYGKMLEEIKALSKVNPQNAGWLWDSEMTFARFGDFVGALDHALTMAPDHPQLLNLKGLVCKTLRKSDEELKSYTRAIEQIRNNPIERKTLAIFLLNRARYYKVHDRIDLADADVHEAISVHPGIEVPNNLKNLKDAKTDK